MSVVGVVLDFELDVVVLVVMLLLEFGQVVEPVVGSIGGLIDFSVDCKVDITRFIVDVFVGDLTEINQFIVDMINLIISKDSIIHSLYFHEVFVVDIVKLFQGNEVPEIMNLKHNIQSFLFIFKFMLTVVEPDHILSSALGVVKQSSFAVCLDSLSCFLVETLVSSQRLGSCFLFNLYLQYLFPHNFVIFYQI